MKQRSFIISNPSLLIRAKSRARKSHSLTLQTEKENKPIGLWGQRINNIRACAKEILENVEKQLIFA